MEQESLIIYDMLLRLPLFQGMSKTELAEVVGHTKFEFVRFPETSTIVKEGSVCSHLSFLIKGTMNSMMHSDNHTFRVEEQWNAPNMLQLESLFGLTQRYAMNFTALTRCDIMSISKAEVIRLTETYEIFRINLLNIISTHIQRLSHKPWRPTPHSLHEKLVRYFSDHCHRPAGEKTMYVKMEDLSKAIGESRLNVSRELHAMEQDGLIVLGRERIHIPALEELLKA